MALQEIVMSHLAGVIQGHALAFLVEEARIRAIKNAMEYQHKSETHDSLPFVQVYTDEKARLEARIEKDEAFPEIELKFAVVERILITEDSNPKGSPGDRLVKAVVLVRKPHIRPWSRRLLVQAEFCIASNGNGKDYPCRVIVRDHKQLDPDNLEVARELGDI